MNIPCSPDHELEQRLSARLLDVFIRAGLVLVMTMLCYKIFSPFLALMIWALILAVTLYPIHRRLAKIMGGKQGLAATLLILCRHCVNRGADDAADQLIERFASRSD
jgi:predicted PurR-regulated permease PerM